MMSRGGLERLNAACSSIAKHTKPCLGRPLRFRPDLHAVTISAGKVTFSGEASVGIASVTEFVCLNVSLNHFHHAIFHFPFIFFFFFWLLLCSCFSCCPALLLAASQVE